MINIEIYTDGSCNQAAKTGGWSFIIVQDNKIIKEKSGSEVGVTNNQCEMIAAIKALEEINMLEFFDSIAIKLYSDSAYLVNAFVEDWISKWVKIGWLNAYKQPVKNKELWESLIVLQKETKAEFIHIHRMSNNFAKKVDALAKNPGLLTPLSNGRKNGNSGC